MASIYNINYRRAGVGFCFFEPPIDGAADGEWEKYLNVHRYYPTFEKAVEAEFDKIYLLTQLK